MLLLTSTVLPGLPFKPSTALAVTTENHNLVPGNTLDNGSHTWEGNDFTVPSNYTPVGKNTVGAGWLPNATYNFGTFQKDTGSWLPFNGGVDMTQPLTITGNTLANAGGSRPGGHLGDSNGILLTNLSASDLSQGATGPALGVGNLGPNTYFIGNDYAYKEYSWPNYGSYKSATVIARGDGAKAKILSASSSYDASNNSSNTFAMDWENPILNPDGTVTGTMSYTTMNAGTTYTAKTTLIVQKSMSIGFMAATGGNYSKMSVQIYKVIAGKGSQPAVINYLNTATGQQLAPRGTKWEHSTVIANIGETLRVIAPDAAAQPSDYFAPLAPPGYKLDRISDPITIRNFPDGRENPNQLTVSYAPLRQTKTFYYSYSSESKNPPDLPDVLSFSGVTDQKIVDAMPTVQNQLAAHVPDGYYLSQIKPNSGITSVGNSTQETLQTFLKSNPTFSDLADENRYQLTLTPLPQTGTVSFQHDETASENSPELPTNIDIAGLTGETITFNMPALPKGYAVSLVNAPNHKTYPSVEEALAENSYYKAVPNDFNIVVSASVQTATIKYQWANNVPGQNGIDGILQAKLPETSNVVGVTDGKLDFSATPPIGYAIDTVTAPDGQTYTDMTIEGMTALEAAQKANPTFIDGENIFLITLKAIMQKVTLAIVADDSAEETPPDIPQPKVITSALTGAVIQESDIKLTQDWLNNWLSNKAVGWSIAAYEDPKGGKYTDATKQLKQAIIGAGGHVLADNNQYSVELIYNGALTFKSMPSIIDFGSHRISATHKSYNGQIDNSVVISDTRGKKTISPWQLNIRESSPIAEVISNGTNLPFSKPISFANQLSYAGKILNDTDQLIYETATAATGQTTVIDKDKATPLSLSVPIEFQKSLATFNGQVTWTLSSTP